MPEAAGSQPEPARRRCQRRIDGRCPGSQRLAARRVRCAQRTLGQRQQRILAGDVLGLDRVPDLLEVRHVRALVLVTAPDPRGPGRQVLRARQMRDAVGGTGKLTGDRLVGRVVRRPRDGDSGERCQRVAGAGAATARVQGAGGTGGSGAEPAAAGRRRAATTDCGCRGRGALGGVPVGGGVLARAGRSAGAAAAVRGATAVPRAASATAAAGDSACGGTAAGRGGGGASGSGATRIDRRRRWRRRDGSTGGGGGQPGRPSRRRAAGGGGASDRRAAGGGGGVERVPGVAAARSGRPAAAAAERGGHRVERSRRGRGGGANGSTAAGAAAGRSGRRVKRCGWSTTLRGVDAGEAACRTRARRPCPGWPARARRRRSARPWWRGGPRGVLATAVAGPGARRELQAALIAVAGVDGPVAAGLAAGYLIPFAVGGCARLPGEGEAAAADDRAGEGDLGDAYG